MKRVTKIRNKQITKLATGLIGLGIFFAGFSWAETKKAVEKTENLSISLQARKVLKLTDGQERLILSKRAFPGELIQYDVHVVNQGIKPLNNVSPMIPIPKGMVFVPKSAKPAPAEASLDGRSFHPIPLKRMTTLANGETKEVLVPSTEYRALRWHLGSMAAGKEITISARTRLVSVNNP